MFFNIEEFTGFIFYNECNVSYKQTAKTQNKVRGRGNNSIFKMIGLISKHKVVNGLNFSI